MQQQQSDPLLRKGERMGSQQAKTHRIGVQGSQHRQEAISQHL